MEEAVIMIAVHFLLQIGSTLHTLSAHRLRGRTIATELSLTRLDDRGGAHIAAPAGARGQTPRSMWPVRPSHVRRA